MSTGLQCHALVVGINLYGGGIAPLQSAVKDAAAIAEILHSQHQYSVSCLLDSEASAEAIHKHLIETLPSTLETESAFILYFAGHGVALGDGMEGPQGYLLPQDAQLSDENSWLSMDVLRKALEALPCRHLLVVLDCCFAGSFRWASSRSIGYVGRPLYDSQFERYLKGDAWQALTSASHDEKAADLLPGRRNLRDKDALDGHSPFAAALIQGLSGAADSSRGGYVPDGVITATELYQYIFEELVPAGADSIQTPGIWPLRPDNKGEFVFLNPTAALNTQPDPPLDDANNPWMGLEAYSKKDANLFFGRQRVINALLDRVLDEQAPSLLAVVGASGTGKSSVVKAGLIPLLSDPPDELRERIGEWTIVQSPRLRRHPEQQLELILKRLESAPTNHRKLVLIDQFEELYTQCRDPDERKQYLQRLRSLIDRGDGLKVVVTLRSDFEPRPASSDALQDLWQSARFVVPTFSLEELRDVIEGPARVKALYFEPAELVGTLLDEISAMPGGLPLLSFALAEMYRHAQIRRRERGDTDRALTQEDYVAIGGVIGALHKRATMLYDQADALKQRTIRRIFLRMLSQDGARLTRRRVDRRELAFTDREEQKRINDVLDQYIKARLLVADGTHVEPAHDTLIVAWRNVQEWLTESGSQDLLRAVWRDARNWDEHKRNKGFLWNDDPRLAQAIAAQGGLNTLEQEFVSKSNLRKRFRRNSGIGITAFVIATLSIATFVSLRQTGVAQNQTRIAEEQLAEARYANGQTMLEQARQRLNEKDHFAAAMLAAEAIGFRGYGADDSEADAARFPELVDSTKPEYRELLKLLSTANAVSRPLGWGPIGFGRFSLVANKLAGLQNDAIEIWDLDDGEHQALTIPDTASGAVDGIALSADGSKVAALSNDKRLIYLWRLPNGAPETIAVWRGETFEPSAIGFSPNDRFVAAVGGDNALIIDIEERIAEPRDLPVPLEESPYRSLVLNLHSNDSGDQVGATHSFTFGPNSERLFAGSWFGRVMSFQFVDSTSGSLKQPPVFRQDDLTGTNIGPRGIGGSEPPYVNSVAVSPSGEFIAIASSDQLWIGRVATDDRPEKELNVSDYVNFHASNSEIRALAFAPNGTALAIASDDGIEIISFRPTDSNSQVIAKIRPQFTNGGISNISFNASGTIIAYGNASRTVLRDVAYLNLDARSYIENYWDPYSDDNLDLADIKAQFAQMASLSSDENLLREFIESDAFVRIKSRFPEDAKVEFVLEPNGISWLSDDNKYVVLSLAMKSPQSEIAALVIHHVDGSPATQGVELYDRQTGRLLMIYPTPAGRWRIEGFGFSKDGRGILARTSHAFYDSQVTYQWPSFAPDLTLYVVPADCHAFVNSPEVARLAGATIFECGP